MLTHPRLDQLHALGLHGQAFIDIQASGEANGLGHAEWLALLLDRESSLRRDKRLSARLRYAKLRQQACVDDIDYRTPRGLDRALFTQLAEGGWIDAHTNLLICGPAGVGKPGSPRRSAIRPAATTARCSIRASHACYPSSSWPAAMAAISACCARSAASIS
ncbi:hypothetical protein ACVWYQ_003591 [Bradyrhizobium sp. USDA 3397]